MENMGPGVRPPFIRDRSSHAERDHHTRLYLGKSKKCGKKCSRVEFNRDAIPAYRAPDCRFDVCPFGMPWTLPRFLPLPNTSGRMISRGKCFPALLARFIHMLYSAHTIDILCGPRGLGGIGVLGRRDLELHSRTVGSGVRTWP